METKEPHRSGEDPDSATAMTIRRAEPGDLEQVVALDERITGINKRAYTNDLFERYQTRRPDQRFFYVAETGGRVAGFVDVELIIVFAAGHQGACEAGANFEAFGGGQGHDAFGQVGFQLVEDGLAETLG